MSGNQVEVQDWMITSYEVDFGNEIGSGGFGQVFKGTWNKLPVALKVLKTNHGVTPSSMSIRREITMWSRLRHPHVLQFLGANVLGEKPFIVMPFMQNGNARDYIHDHPTYDRLRLLHHIVLGLVYLHSQKVVHGDLKALNILIDDNGKGVLSDFGLSRVKADTTSRSVAADMTGVTGSRNWMAPERLLGGSLKKPCDIYAFAMTLYEVFVEEVPLGDVDYSHFIELVVRNDVRPERPDDEDEDENDRPSQLTDAVWVLAERCWVKDPKKRPTAEVLCDAIVQLLENRDIDPLLEWSPVTLPISPPSSLFSIQDSSFSTASSPSSSKLLTPSAKFDSEATLITGPALIDLRDEVKVFSSPSSAPLKMQSSDAISSDGPFRELIRAPIPPNGVQDPPEATPPTAVRSHMHSKLLMDHPILVPPIWEGRQDADVHPIFVDQESQETSWLDSQHNELADYKKQETTRLAPNTTGNELPPGGECQVNASGYPYYAKTTTLVHPIHSSPNSSPQISPMNSNVPRLTITQIQQISAHKGNLLCLAVSPNGMLVATGGEDGAVRIWDTGSWNPVGNSLEDHVARVTCVTFSPDSERIASGSADSTIRVWDSRTGERVGEPFLGHSGAILSIGFSPNGDFIASGSKDKTCRVWNSRTGDMVLRPLQGHDQPIRSVCFSAGGTRIATGSLDKTIRIWSLQSGALVCRPLRGLKNATRMLAFTDDGQRIVAGSKERRFCTWHPESGALISGPTDCIGRTVLASLFQPNGQACLTASADGLWIATGTLSNNFLKTDDMNIQLWDPDTGQRVGTSYQNSARSIKCVAFSPNGKQLFAGSTSYLEVFNVK